MALDKQGRSQTANSIQELQNDSFDPEFRVAVVEMLGVDSSTVPPTLNRLKVLPDGSLGDALPTSGNNPSTAISEDTVGTVTTTIIQKTIGATTYQQTIVEDSSDSSTTISAWSVV